MKFTNLLRNRKVAVVLVLLLAFGTGLSSMLFENPTSSSIPDFGSSIREGLQSPPVGIAPQTPAPPPIPEVPGPVPAPAPFPQPQVVVKEVIKEVPKEVIKEVPKGIIREVPAGVPRSPQRDAANAILPLQQQSPPDRMVISTASIGLNVSSVSQAVADLRRIVESLGGFVTDSFVEPIPRGRFVENGILLAPTSRASVTMRIPSDQLDRALTQILALGERISYNTNSRDVTEQHVDIAARLKNQQTVLAQYKEILSRANTVTEILNVQQRIDYVQEQIEVLTAQVKRLENQASFATITVGLVEPQVVEKPKKEEQNLLDRLLIQPLAIALSLAEIEVRGLLILIVGLLPLYPIMGAGYIAYRKYSSRAKKDN